MNLFKRKNRNLIIQQHRDRYLRQYCKDEGITLLEIPFTEYDRIPSVLHEFFKDRGVYDNNIYTTNSDESVKLENMLSIPIILQDERLTTKSANDMLIDGNVSRKNRKKVVDSIAATIILQTYLDRSDK